MNTMPYKKCSALMETLDNITDSSGVLLVRADLVERITKVWIEVLAASKITTNHNERFEQMFRLLEDKMKKIQQLHVFSLPTADLKYFAVDIFPAMEVLKLDLCPPSTIKGIYTMRNVLTTLVITNSGITNLSRTLAPFKKRVLRTLSPMIFPDTINNIPQKFLWSNLLTLKLSNCGISKIDESLHFFPSIEHLDLSHNTISHIIHLQDCIDLKYVNFSYNRIRVLSNFERVIGSVTMINLAHNEVESLDGVDRILSLEKLDISYNRINDFGEIQVLCRLPNIEFIRLEGNPLALNAISNRHYRMNIFHAFIADGTIMNGNRPFPVLDGVPMTLKEKQFFKRILFRSTTDKEATFSHFNANLLSSTDVLLDQELGGDWGNIDYNSEGDEAEFGDIYAHDGGEKGDFSFVSEDANASSAPVIARSGSSGGVGELSSPGVVLQGSFSSLGPGESQLSSAIPGHSSSRSSRHSVATSGSGRHSPQPFLGIAGAGGAAPRNTRASVDGSHPTRSPMQGRQLSVNFRSSLSPQTFSPIHGIAASATRQSMYGRAISMGGGDSRASFMSTGGGGGPLGVSSPSKRLALRIIQAANNASKLCETTATGTTTSSSTILRVKRKAPIINAGEQELYPDLNEVEENMKIIREKLHAEALVLAHERLLEKQKQEQIEREKQIRASTLMSAMDSTSSPGRSYESPVGSFGSAKQGQSASLESKFNEEQYRTGNNFSRNSEIQDNTDSSKLPIPATATMEDTGRRVGVDLSADGRDTPGSFTPVSLLRGIDTRGTKTGESSALPSPAGERATGQQLRYSFSSESDVPTHPISQNNSFNNLSVAGSYTASEMSAYERANAKGRGLLTINNPLALQRRGSATQHADNLSEMSADSPLPDYAGSDCGDDPRRSSFSQSRLSISSTSKLSYASIVASPRNNPELRASVDHRALGLANTTTATNTTSSVPGSAIDSGSFEEVAGAPNTYVGDPDYKNLSVVENMDLYMKEQVFNVKRPSGISPYMRDSTIDADSVGIAGDNADLSNIFIKTAHRYEKFITVFCEKVIDITGTTSTLRTTSNTTPSTPPRIKMSRRDQLPKADEEASAAQEETRYLVLTDTSLYLVRVDFPLQTLFVEAPIPTVIRSHKLYSLCKCTIFFGFQRCILGFADESQYKDLIYDNLAAQAENTTSNSNSIKSRNEDLTLSGEIIYYQYMILTREKVRTYPLITRINKAANLQRNSFIPIPLSNVNIDNKDFQLVEKVMQCTLTLGGDHDIVHYQMAYQVWRKRPGVKLPRTIILTQSLLILCSEELNSIDINLDVIDTSSLNEVQKIYMDDNPLYVTFILKSNTLFAKTRKWRMCTDSRAMSTKLQEECRRACADMGNPV